MGFNSVFRGLTTLSTDRLYSAAGDRQMNEYGTFV